MILTYYISTGWTRKKAIKFANFEAIAKITKRKLFPQSIIPLIIRIIVIILIVLALAEFGVWYTGNVSNNDYVLIMDASGSMLADDYEPNRLEAAKEAANAFTDQIDSHTKISVAAFAGTPLLIQSLTPDKEKISEAIKSIKIIQTGGTAIGDAVALGVNVLEAQEDLDKGRAIILLTDGQSNVGMTIDDAIEYANLNGVAIYTIGIGTKEGGQFTEDKVTSQIDTETLENIAKSTGGSFYLTTNTEELKESYKLIFSSKNGQIFFDAKKYLLIISFILLLIEWIITNTRYKTIV